MKGLKAVPIAHKKLNIEAGKKRKAEKIAGAPKRPISAFLVFMEDFRKSYKENFPDNKSFAAVGKAGGEKWKALSESEKAPYMAKAEKKKTEYVKAMEEFNKKLKSEESDKLSSEVHDDGEQEASS